MSYVVKALNELGIDEWILRGTPTSEAEFNSMFCKVTGVDANGLGIESNNPADFGVAWSQVSAKVTELQNAEPMRLLREERNRRLAETDWWASSDLTMTDAQKKYRQDLETLPSLPHLLMT